MSKPDQRLLLNERYHAPQPSWQIYRAPKPLPIGRWIIIALLLGWVIADLLELYRNWKGL